MSLSGKRTDPGNTRKRKTFAGDIRLQATGINCMAIKPSTLSFHCLRRP